MAAQLRGLVIAVDLAIFGGRHHRRYSIGKNCELEVCMQWELGGTEIIVC